MTRLSVVLLVLMLSACAGARTFDGDMRAAFVGQPLDAAIAKLGRPTGQYMAGGDTVYVWQKRDSESIFGKSVTKGSGYQILGQMPDGHGLYWQGVTYNRCTIRATTHNQTVAKVTFEGNPGGCEAITGAKRKVLGRRLD